MSFSEFILSVPVFFTATTLDLLILLIIGIFWSAGVWILTEGLKRRIGLSSSVVYQRRIMVWSPLLVSGLLALAGFPVALAGVGVEVVNDWRLFGFSFLIGIVGGMGAKVAHDRASQILETTFGRVLRIIGGSDA